jgi:hypothetical protein
MSSISEESIWTYMILDKCHRGEEFRLFEEQIYPLNKSNTKYLKIGYSPFDNFKLKFVIWDVATNKEIIMEMHDIVSMQLFLMTDTIQRTSIELSSAELVYNRTNHDLIHIIEKNTHKLLSFHVATLKNLVLSKQIYQFPMRRSDLASKADDVVKIMKTKVVGYDLNECEIRTYYEGIIAKMINPDRIFLGEFIFKFPTTFLAVMK